MRGRCHPLKSRLLRPQRSCDVVPSCCMTSYSKELVHGLLSEDLRLVPEGFDEVAKGSCRDFFVCEAQEGALISRVYAICVADAHEKKAQQNALVLCAILRDSAYSPKTASKS